jgi:hypothetical protein
MSVNPNHTSRSRDAALRRWLIAGSATLAAVLTAVAASAFPGKTLKETRATSARKAHRSSGATGTRTGNGTSKGSGTSKGTSALKAPAQVPQSSTTEGSSSSGSSATESSAPQESSSAPAETSEAPVTSGGS